MQAKAVFFDCDGVLIFGGPYARLHEEINLPREVDLGLIGDYYAGKITYEEWTTKLRVHYKSAELTHDRFIKALDKKYYDFNPEAQEVVDFLQERSINIAIISSGIDYYIAEVAKTLGIDTWRANNSFKFDEDGKFDRVVYSDDDPAAKVTQVTELCTIWGIKPEETLFVGDSANDLGAFELTKHGLLYRTENSEYEKKAWRRIHDLREIKGLMNEL